MNYERSEIIAFWQLQESRIQTYRQIFIAGLTLLFAINATLQFFPIAKNTTNLSFIEILSQNIDFVVVTIGLLISFIMLSVWKNQEKNVKNAINFLQFCLRELDNGNTAIVDLKIFSLVGETLSGVEFGGEDNYLQVKFDEFKTEHASGYMKRTFNYIIDGYWLISALLSIALIFRVFGI